MLDPGHTPALAFRKARHLCVKYNMACTQLTLICRVWEINFMNIQSDNSFDYLGQNMHVWQCLLRNLFRYSTHQSFDTVVISWESVVSKAMCSKIFASVTTFFWWDMMPRLHALDAFPHRIGRVRSRGCNHCATTSNYAAIHFSSYRCFQQSNTAMTAVAMLQQTLRQPAGLHAKAFTARRPIRNNCRYVCRASNDKVSQID